MSEQVKVFAQFKEEIFDQKKKDWIIKDHGIVEVIQDLVSACVLIRLPNKKTKRVSKFDLDYSFGIESVPDLVKQLAD